MRGELDFEGYVAARGATVVRCLVLLGLEPAEAEDTATAVFASLRPDWHELQQSADPDVTLWLTVLAVETRRRRRAQHAPLDEASVARVLRGAAALEELQVCDVLGSSVPQVRALLAGQPPEQASDEDVALATLPLPYARVRALARRRRLRQWLVTGGVAAIAAMAVAVGVALSRPEPVQRPGDVLPPAPATAEANPAGLVWWADGELHLASSVVRIAEVRRLVAAGTGAAYVDPQGRLIGVTANGDRTLMGRPAEGSPLVSSPRLGLVAWADASVPDVTRLVVWDVEAQRQLAAVTTRPRVRPITFDGGWLRFGQGLRDWAWDPSGGPAQLTGDGFSDDPNERTALVDAVAGIRVEQWGTFLRVVRSGLRGETKFVGFGGSLSSDGRLVLTGPEQGREPRLYDTRSGDQLDAWRPDWLVRAAVFADGGRVSWLADQGGGELVIVTCGTTARSACSGYVELGQVEDVLLAGDTRR